MNKMQVVLLSTGVVFAVTALAPSANRVAVAGALPRRPNAEPIGKQVAIQDSGRNPREIVAVAG